MKKQISSIVQSLSRRPISELPMEFVERKGLGHPDSMCDAIAEATSLAIARSYMKTFGTVLHHNLDKSLLVAGSVERRFGGGRVVKPMRLILGDRATFNFDQKEVPVGDVAVEAARNWIQENLRFVDPLRHVQYQVEIQPGSEELQDVFKRRGLLLGANDTSCGAGFAPLTLTESTVLETELYLNSAPFKDQFPETGEDVKIMAIRNRRELRLTVAVPFIDRFIADEADYFLKKRRVQKAIRAFVESRSDFSSIQISLNALDQRGRGHGGIYLSVLGTSAEDADSGEVGRGNRVNGLICFQRPASMEAAAGKNSVSHVGKIYNIFAHKLARRIHEEVPGIHEVYVWLVSQIGRRIDNPEAVLIQFIPTGKSADSAVSRSIRHILGKELQRMSPFIEELLSGKYPVC